jgi:diguanylate cyclase (GGDEF)-like protein
LALILTSVAIVAGVGSSADGVTLPLSFANALLILGEAIKWRASRTFSRRPVALAWVLLGPACFLLAVHSGYLATFGGRLILLCSLLAFYNFAAAFELSRADGAQLVSRWPAVVLLIVTALGFLSWMPLIGTMSIDKASAVFSNEWLPSVILYTLLVRVALAFTVLSMAKERQEWEQRIDALTDELTGLPNRRALFEAADALAQRKDFKDEPISVLLFDLDHFKATNDGYGHEAGDVVLKLFARKLSEKLDGASIVARLGGEEFAAILPGAGPRQALAAAEDVRRAFAKSAAFVNGVALGATVSVGAASELAYDRDLGGLFRRADAALYAAKRAGRNRVEMLEPESAVALEVLKGKVRAASRDRPVPREPGAFKKSA